jgi:hypothetical protein
MSEETLGYVQLEWTCPKCNSRNPGTEKICQGCGAPQPQDVQFEQAAGAQVTQDETLKKAAEKGADIHCAFCGARNPADAAVCAQCGADLKEGTRREVGRVVGAYQSGPVKQVACPNCGQANPENTLRCARCGAPLTLERPAAAPAAPAAPARRSPLLIYGAVALAVLACICLVAAFAWLSSPRESLAGRVLEADWQTRVAVEELRPVQHDAWQDEIPQNAVMGACLDKVRSVQDQQPAGGDFNKVCGTPYTVDTGSGVGKVVQECQFEVLAPYCEYTVQEWQVVDQATESGSDYQPIYASPRLNNNQRLGDQNVTYTIVFETDKGRYEYTVSSLEEFKRFQIGSEWTLKLNALNSILDVEAR